MGNYIFVLEMMIQTIDGMLNEPIGAYSTEENAQEWIWKKHSRGLPRIQLCSTRSQ